MIQLHCHTHNSNVSSPDVAITEKQLVKRAVELGHKAIALTDHGNNIGKFKFAKECKNNGIKAIHGIEFYYVKDRDIEIEGAKDRTNSHLIILAKNKQGLIEINRLSSDAHVNGVYYKPRIDNKSITKFLNPNNVVVCSACIGSPINKYDESIIDSFQSFIDVGNFYLEVQAHPNDRQKEYNRKLKQLAFTRNLPMIVSCDIHAIDEKSSKMRDLYVKEKGINYDDEEGWYVDFNSDKELEMRLLQQEVFSKEEIRELMSNTDSIGEQIEDFDITEYNLDVPIIKQYKDKTLEERFHKLKEIVYDKMETYISTNGLNRDIYVEHIEKELGEIYKCNMQDYFLLNYHMIDLAVNKYGGVITKTSRGSAVCFLINFFLGFTSIDKLKFPELPLYSERFMTAERILESKSAVDVDNNVSSQEPFYKATEELLGEDNVYPMIALGLFRVKSAWKLFARMNNLDIELANEISLHIEEYDKAMKYSSDEEKELINVEDYIPEQYKSIFNESKDIRGIIDNIKPHPCGHIVSSKSIIDNIGLVSVGKDKVICAGIEGSVAESVGYLKQDVLVVTIVDLLDRIYKRIGIKQHSAVELLELTKNDDKIWDIYEKGLTFEVNQFTSDRTKKICANFKPKNIIEVSALGAG